MPKCMEAWWHGRPCGMDALEILGGIVNTWKTAADFGKIHSPGRNSEDRGSLSKGRTAIKKK